MTPASGSTYHDRIRQIPVCQASRRRPFARSFYSVMHFSALLHKEERPSFDGRFSFSCTLAYNPRLTAAAENLCGAERPQCGIQRGGSAGETGRKAHSARFSTMFHHGTGCKFESNLRSHQRNLFCLPRQKRFLCCFMGMNMVLLSQQTGIC